MKLSLPSLSFSKTSTGLVIRSKDVELLSMEGRKVKRRVRVPIEGKEDAHVTQAIQQALSSAGPGVKRVAVSIPAQDVLFRFFTIPVLPKAEWDSAVQFEARKYIPFKIEGLVWDFRTVPSTEPNKLEVIFAAVQREAFRKTQEVLGNAGVQPTIIEPRSLSLARLVEPSASKQANEFVCVVDVEEESAHLAIVKDRLPYLTRDVGLLANSDAEAQGVADAAGGASAPETVPISASMESMEPLAGGTADSRAQRLFSELRVSMDFFTREYPSTSVTRVLLFGDESLLGPWCRWLAEQLHCSVELGSALLTSYVQDGVPLSSASAVGLLQAGKESGGVSLDFLKRGAVKAPGIQRGALLDSTQVTAKVAETLKNPKTIALVGAVAGCLFIVWLLGAQQVELERQKLDRLVRSRPDIGWGLRGMSMEDLKSLREKVEAQDNALQEIMDHRLRVVAKLDALARSLPDGVWLTSLSFEDSVDFATGQSHPHLTVNGACFLGEAGEEMQAIQELEHRVKGNAKFFNGFSTARVGQINAQVANTRTRDRYQTFLLDCRSDRRL